MPTIAESLLPLGSYPSIFVSPFYNDPMVPFYSSIPMLNQKQGDCVPCVACGINTRTLPGFMQEGASMAVLAAAGSLDPSSGGSVVVPGQEGNFNLNSIPVVFLTTDPPIPPDPPDPPTPYAYPFDRTDPDMIAWFLPENEQVFSGEELVSWADFSEAENNIISGGVRGDVIDTFSSVRSDDVVGAGAIFRSNTANRYESATNYPNLTFIAVAKTGLTTPWIDFAPLNFNSGSFGKDRGMFFEDSPEGFGLHLRGSTRIVTSSGFVPSKWYVLVMTVEENPGTASAFVTVYINGLLKASQNFTSLSSRGIPSFVDAGTNFPQLRPAVLEAIAFRRLITPTELAKLQEYCAKKYPSQFSAS